jgi:hypothetical protein
MSTDNCPNCNKSILNQTPYLIGTTKCNNPCPPEGVCDDQIPSNCVFYSGQNLSCSGIQNGDTLTTSLTKIESKLCLVQDKCYEWENATFAAPFDDPDYNNVGLLSDWQNVSPSVVKYSKDPINCKVALQGVCTANIINGVPIGSNQTDFVNAKLFDIPAAITPSINKALSTIVEIKINNLLCDGYSLPMLLPAVIYIGSTGEVRIRFTDFSYYLSFPTPPACYCEDSSLAIGAVNYRWLCTSGEFPQYLTVEVTLDGLYYELT